MLLFPSLGMACLTAALLSPITAPAADLPSAELPMADMSAILGLALERVHERLKPETIDKMTFTVVAEPPLRELKGVTVFGKPVRMFTRQEAREQQLADFVSMTPKAPDARQVVVHYSHPGPAQFGTVTFAAQEKGWAVVDHKSYHSSSGARFFYGAMYEGVECRDDTEMAERWNYYVKAFRPKDAEPPAAGNKCPGTTFPEVNAYRSMKRLSAPKASESSP